jgi:hypothetical protein
VGVGRAVGRTVGDKVPVAVLPPATGVDPRGLLSVAASTATTTTSASPPTISLIGARRGLISGGGTD